MAFGEPTLSRCKVELAFSAVKHNKSPVFFHPSGMLLAPLVSGSSAGQVNVPEEATPYTQLVVAFVGSQTVKLTSIDARLLQLSNIQEQQELASVVAGKSGVDVKDVQRENIPLQQLLANVVAGKAGAVVKDVQPLNIPLQQLLANVVAGKAGA